jgi:hypothetical protein
MRERIAYSYIFEQTLPECVKGSCSPPAPKMPPCPEEKDVHLNCIAKRLVTIRTTHTRIADPLVHAATTDSDDDRTFTWPQYLGVVPVESPPALMSCIIGTTNVTMLQRLAPLAIQKRRGRHGEPRTYILVVRVADIAYGKFY